MGLSVFVAEGMKLGAMVGGSYGLAKATTRTGREDVIRAIATGILVGAAAFGVLALCLYPILIAIEAHPILSLSVISLIALAVMSDQKRRY